MTGVHTFIDSAGGRFPGKATAVEVWKSFFAAFPDSRNVFEAMTTNDDTVAIAGKSECESSEELDGPALWTARSSRTVEGVRGHRREQGPAGPGEVTLPSHRVRASSGRCSRSLKVRSDQTNSPASGIVRILANEA